MVGVTFLILFILLEISVRLFRTESDNLIMQDPVLGWVHVPNKKGYSRSKEFSVKIRINKDGFIGRDYGYSKPDNTIRILTIGDSLTEAFQVPEEKSYSQFLEKNLKANFTGSHFEVLNMGIAGYGTQREYYVLKNTGLKFKPDIVVLGFFVGNDFSDNMSEDVNPDASFSKYRDIKNKIKLFARNHSAAWRFILRKKSKNKLLLSLFNKNSGSTNGFLNDDKNRSENIQKKLERSTELIKDIKILSDSNDISLVVAILPSGGQVYDYDESRNSERLRKGLASVLEKSKINYVDLLPYFKNWASLNYEKLLYLPLDGHPSEYGHYVIAEGIASYLTNFLQKHGNF